MSWLALSVLIFLVGFAIALLLSEWVARRLFGRGGDDRSSPG